MWLSIILLASSCLALHPVESTPPVIPGPRNPVEGWVNVRLNHFDASNTETFPMRYYYNSVFASENVVIYVGGKGSISQSWVNAGLAHELAQAVGAGLFHTEHRYYGQSRPSNDTSSSALRYLTVDQALGDLAQFIQYVKSDQFEGGRYKNGKVALVGCSYAGSMATWMRFAYPHLIDAVFSDSGPLLAQEDFSEYLEIVAEALRSQGGEQCLSGLQESMEQLVELLATQAGPAQVSQMFNTCSTIQTSTPLDLATFFWFGITDTVASLVQNSSPGDISAACDVIGNTSADPVQRLADWITSQPGAQPCIETRYTEVVAAHTNTSYDSPKSLMRLWTYQTCVEFGWFQTTTSQDQPFLTTVPLEFFHQMCKDFFSAYFDESLLRSGIERTNLFFGGLTHLPDRVVSVAGGHDPWSPMGPNASHATPLAPVYVVPGVSHCRAVRPVGDGENEALVGTRRAVFSHLVKYVTGEPSLAAGGTRDLVSMAALLLVALAFIA